MNAITGIVIGICIALPILIVATMNVIGGTFATLIIAFVTICVLGILPLAGWKLDVSVSISLTFVRHNSPTVTFLLKHGGLCINKVIAS